MHAFERRPRLVVGEAVEDLVVRREALLQPPLPAKALPEQRLCLDPDRIGRRCQVQGSLRPVHHVRTPQTPDGVQGPPLRHHRAQRRVARVVGVIPGRTEQAFGLDGLPAKDGEVAERGVAQRSGGEGDSLPREGLRLDEVARTGHGIHGAEQPLLPVPAVRAEPAAFDERPGRPRPGADRRLPSREGVEIGDEFGIGRGHRHDAMTQRRGLVVDEPGRTRMQPHAAGRPELFVHGRLHQWMAEGDTPDPGVVAQLQQVEVDGLVQGLDRVGHLRERRSRGERRRSAEHGGGLDQPTCRRTTGVQPADHPHGERAGSRQHRLPGAPPFLGHLREKSGDVERVPLGVRVQLPGDPGRQPLHAESGGQARDLLGREGGEPDGRSRSSGRHPAQALRESGRGLAALRQESQHPLPHQSAHHEQERPQRVDIGPVGVVDDDHDGRLLLEVLEHLEDAGPDSDRFLGGQRQVPTRPGTSSCSRPPCASTGRPRRTRRTPPTAHRWPAARSARTPRTGSGRAPPTCRSRPAPRRGRGAGDRP